MSDAIAAAVSAATADAWNAFIAVHTDPNPSSTKGALAGIPVAVKDIIDHAGQVTTAGSSFYRHLAERSAPCLRRLEQAGAVIVGRTNLHEFAFGFSSENDWFGPVRNPWDPTASAGGSSGGSAAAVAAGIVPIAIGTDTGGSVRVPAALCGCVGLKVTHGRIPLTGVFPLAASLDTVGPITRSVADATLAYLAMAGEDAGDPWSASRPVTPPDERPLTGLRVAVPHPWVDRPLDPAVEEGFTRLRSALTGAGALVTDITAPALDPTGLPRAAYAEVALVHRRWLEEDPTRYGPAIRDRMLGDLIHDADAVAQAHQWRHWLRRTMERIFAAHDLLITPTTSVRRKAIGAETVAVGEATESYRPALSWFTTLINQAGVPAIALPLNGTAAPGLPPVSVQIVARWWEEGRLLSVAANLESSGVVGFTQPDMGAS